MMAVPLAVPSVITPASWTSADTVSVTRPTLGLTPVKAALRTVLQSSGLTESPDSPLSELGACGEEVLMASSLHRVTAL